MSLHDVDGRLARSNHPIATEFGVVTAILVGVYLWQQVVDAALELVFGSPPAFESLFASSLFYAGGFVLGLAAFAAVYTEYRAIRRGLALPSRSDVGLVGLAAVVPVALVGLTKLVGVFTSVPYNSLTLTSVAAGAPLRPVLAVLGIGLLVGVPVLVLVCQVLVQGSFERAVDAHTAVVLTTLVTGFAMVSNTGGLATVPDLGRLVGVVAFALLLLGGLYARELSDRDRLRTLALVPLVVFVGLVVVSGIAGMDSVAGVLFVGTHVAVLGIAAYTYQRTESVVVPALAYTSLLLANRAVVVLFEAGMQSW